MRLERCQIETVTRQTDQRTSGPVGQTPQRIWTGLRKDTSKRTPAHSASTRLFDFTHLICCIFECGWASCNGRCSADCSLFFGGQRQSSSNRPLTHCDTACGPSTRTCELED